MATLRPAGWLTSLWALQEACPRPHLRLLNEDFEALCVGTCDQEVTLDSLCSCRWHRHSRGPAIMAAVGITEWFQNPSLPRTLTESDKDLVLDLYPYTFIQEFHQKVGALFFARKEIKSGIWVLFP